MKDTKLARDLVTFARLEIESRDMEPWAMLLNVMRQDMTEEQSIWLASLYNTYDSLDSAWGVYSRWDHPLVWRGDTEHREEARQFPCMQERRNLHGGRVNIRLLHYAEKVHAAGSQKRWLSQPVNAVATTVAEKERNFVALMKHVKSIWGVGRQASFEWVEFLAKVNGFPCHAPTAELWESSGPRKSLEILYEDDAPTPARLEEYAQDCRAYLAAHGIDLVWEDFETIICDFKVMQKGRYYPGRHLAALRGEIEDIGGDAGARMLEMFRAMIPAPWCDIPPYIDKTLMPVYRDTGNIVTPV